MDYFFFLNLFKRTDLLEVGAFLHVNYLHLSRMRITFFLVTLCAYATCYNYPCACANKGALSSVKVKVDRKDKKQHSGECGCTGKNLPKGYHISFITCQLISRAICLELKMGVQIKYLNPTAAKLEFSNQAMAHIHSYKQPNLVLAEFINDATAERQSEKLF